MDKKSHMEPKDIEIDTNQNVRIGSKQDGFLGITLPECIEDVSLKEGEKAGVKLETGLVNGEEYQYLKLTEIKSEPEKLSYAEKRDTFMIRFESGSLFVRFPLDAVREEESPFHDISIGTGVFTEINRVEGFIGIYTEEMFQLRNRQLVSKDRGPWIRPLGAGLISRLFNGSEYVDLAKGTPFGSQKFKLVPFDVQNRIFRNNTGSDSDEYHQPDPENFQDIAGRGKIPPKQTLKFRIEWDHAGVGDVALKRKQTIYQTYLARETNVILPSKGTFKIVTKTWKGTDATYLNNNPEHSFGSDKRTKITENWEGEFHSNSGSEDYITVYIPCQ